MALCKASLCSGISCLSYARHTVFPLPVHIQHCAHAPCGVSGHGKCSAHDWQRSCLRVTPGFAPCIVGIHNCNQRKPGGQGIQENGVWALLTRSTSFLQTFSWPQGTPHGPCSPGKANCLWLRWYGGVMYIPHFVVITHCHHIAHLLFAPQHSPSAGTCLAVR